MKCFFKFLLAGIACMSLLSLAADDNSLIGYWPLNEGTGTVVKDLSSSKNDGQILNNMRAVKWVEGRNGKALLLECPGKIDSYGAVMIPKLGKHDFSKGITLEAWIKFSPSFKREKIYEIVSNATKDSGPGFRLIMSWHRLIFASGDGKNMFYAATTPAKFPFHAGIWYHVAGTYDGSVFKVYVDGVEAGASKPDQKMTKGSDSIFIGSYRGGYAYGFDGAICDVKIYNKVLSPLEIAKQSKGL